MDLSETNVVLSGGNEGLVVSIVSGLALATIVRSEEARWARYF